MRSAAGLFSRYLHSTRTTSFFPRCDGYSGISVVVGPVLQSGLDSFLASRSYGCCVWCWSTLGLVDSVMHIFVALVVVAVSTVPVPSWAGLAVLGVDDSVADGYHSGLLTEGVAQGGDLGALSLDDGLVQQDSELSVAVAENRLATYSEVSAGENHSRPHTTRMHPASGNLGERTPRRRRLPIPVGAPAHHRTIRPHTTRIPVGGNLGERTPRRHRPPIKRVVAPAHHRTIRPHTTRMQRAGRNLGERTPRPRRLPIPVGAPAHHRTIRPHTTHHTNAPHRPKPG